MKQKEVPEMDDVEEIILKISEESPYKRRPTQKRTWMTVPEMGKLLVGIDCKDHNGRVHTYDVMAKLKGKNPKGYEDVCYKIGESISWTYFTGSGGNPQSENYSPNQ